MTRARIVWVGKTRQAGLAALIDDLAGRISRLIPFEITELKDPKSADRQRQIAAEAERILGVLDESDRVIVLDAGGRYWDSSQFAAFLGTHLSSDARRLTFVVGGYGGLDDAVKNRAERIWALSPLTFTHEIARLLVVEQLYRGLANLKNLPYSR